MKFYKKKRSKIGHLKLTLNWEGPYQVLETSTNSAVDNSGRRNKEPLNEPDQSIKNTHVLAMTEYVVKKSGEEWDAMNTIQR